MNRGPKTEQGRILERLHADMIAALERVHAGTLGAAASVEACPDMGDETLTAMRRDLVVAIEMRDIMQQFAARLGELLPRLDDQLTRLQRALDAQEGN